MGFLGYDRDRLTALRRRLDELDDEAARLRFDDPLAGAAARLYRGAVSTMVGWRAELGAIAGCAFASPYQPVWLDPTDSALVDVLRPTDAAWATTTDPRAGAAVTPDERARHLAEFLAALDVSAVLEDDRRRHELLAAVAGLGDAAGTFLATLDPARFGRVVEDLARRVAAGDAGAGSLLGGLAATLGSAYRTGAVDRRRWAAALAAEIDPYASALVLAAAGLSGADLGRVAAAVWHRWVAAGAAIDVLQAAPTQTPALLVPVLSADPLAARDALASFDDDDLAQLFGSAVPSGTALPLLLASAQPLPGDGGAVERSMVAVLTFLRHHQDLATFSGVSDGLGAYVGPYLEQIVSAPDESGYPASRWDLHGQAPADLIGWTARSNTSAAALETAVAALVATRFAELTAAGHATGPVIDHLGALAGTIDAVVAEAHRLKAAERNAAWRAGWSLVAGLASLPSTGPGSRIVASNLKGWGLDALRQLWESNGWIGTPPAPDAVAAADDDEIDEREDRRQADLMAMLFAAALAAGTMPASAAPPALVPGEPFLATRNRWLAEAASPDDAEARERLWRAAEAYDAGVQRARADT